MVEDNNEDQESNEAINDSDLESVAGGRRTRGDEPLPPQGPDDRIDLIKWFKGLFG